MATGPSVCVIGAGSSGIAAVKALADAGLEVTAYEASDRVGGNWVFGNANGTSASYSTLHINTSRERMAYADFPMPASYPDFPHHSQVAAYFEAYVDAFGLRDRIRFETRVDRAERGPGGGWEVTAGAGTTPYDVLVVANGHHWDPRWPEPAFPGADTFAGEQLHAHDYVDPEQLRGRDVVVLGMGNSAMDIAVDASYAARSTTLAARRGAHIVPKYLFGRPMDTLAGQDPRIPFRVRQAMVGALLRLTQGQPERYGLPRPDHRFGEAHPTVSGRILDRLAHGAVVAKPNLARLEGASAVFADGTSVPCDLVVYCTGYKVSFPFLDPDLVSAPDNDLPLFKRVFHPALPDLAFVGLLQPLGAVMPLAEAQSAWIAAWLTGAYALPGPRAMRADMDRERRRMHRRYVASKRHTMQVDFEDYLYALRRERARGAQRAGTGRRDRVAA